MKAMMSVALAVTVLLSPQAHAQSPADAELLETARAIHDRVITIDSHVDIPNNFATPAYDFVTLGGRNQQVHLPTMVDGGLDAVFLVVFAAQGPLTQAGYAKALSDAFAKFAGIHRLTSELYPDQLGLALSPADVRRISDEGKKVILIGIENGYSIGRDIRLLDQFYDYGARYFGLLHNGHNDLADSSQPQARLNDAPELHGGLSDLGRQVVQRTNELGIMLDVSHSSRKATMDIVEASAVPVIASHSSAVTEFDHPRNLTDEEMLAIAGKGGVVQIVAFDGYLRAIPAEKTAAIREMWGTLGIRSFADFRGMSDETYETYQAEMVKIDEQWPRASVSDLVDHIDYSVELIGLDHVGISSDFNGGGGIDGWSDASETFNVTLELVRRGYTEAQIEKLWGENLLRVFQEVEDYAGTIR